MAYNYDAFDARHYDLARFRGPLPGDRAPDVDLRDASGAPVRLLDFEGEFLVLETGSLTCPLFQGRRPGMARLDERFPDVTFAVLYVREAHPGASIPAHRTVGDKQACALRLAGEEGERRRSLVDDLVGTAHSAFGGYPNSVHILNRRGCVLWVSDWNDPGATGRALADLTAGRPAAARAFFKPVAPSVSLRVLGNGGRGALADFLRSFPRLVWANLIRRNLRLLFGRAPGVAPDTHC